MFLASKKFKELPQYLPEDLLDIQFSSYNWFLTEGIQEVLKEFTPTYDYSGEDFKVEFLSHTIGDPFRSEEEAIDKEFSYTVPLRIKVKVTNLKTGESEVQDIYFGEIPLMTQRGTFILNGVERVIVNQLVRSPGVYFTAIEYGERKFFGANVIPFRGAWLEFQTELNNVITVKIDRRKKVLATVLLKAFGIENNEELIKIFQDVDISEISYIETTLKKDETQNTQEALIEIHHRLKPLELSTIDNALKYFNSVFKDKLRYDLSWPGRYKINKKLNRDSKSLVLELEDLILIVKEIINLNNNPKSKPDDIDSLENKRLRSVGELVQGRFRVGMMRLVKRMKDKIAILGEEAISPAKILYPKDLTNTIFEFFLLSPLSQFLDQTNILAELEHKRRITTAGPGGISKERAGFEVRDVHPTFYGRICPVQTPEGQNVGVISYPALYARAQKELGFLQTPYYRVKNRKITEEIVWLTPEEEYKEVITHQGIEIKNGKIVNDWVEARAFGETKTVRAEEVTLIDVSLFQPFSVSASLIPFLEKDDANRALMGANMQRQAVGLVKPEIAIVRTGLEEKVARDSRWLIIAPDDGVIEEVDAEKIVLRKKDGRTVTFKIKKFLRTNQYLALSQRPIVHKNQKVTKGQILADVTGTKDGKIALGRNVLVAFMSWGGLNFEDAIIVSEKLVKEDYFTNISIEDFYCDVKETRIGPEEITYDIPGVPEAKLINLDENGIVRVGTFVKSGDILVGKVTPKKEIELTPEERLLKAIFGEKISDVKPTPLVLEHGKDGRVIGISILSRDQNDPLEPDVIKRIRVRIAKLRKLQIGDKLCGRHGNKGVISRIVPEEDMPFLPDGTAVEVILNPLGIISRMNLGQLFETHLAMAAKKLGYEAIVPLMTRLSEEILQEELKKAGFSPDGKFTLYDGKTGEKYNERVTVGYMYMYKLIHMVEDKIHVRSTGPYSLITQQPLGGRSRMGGQRLGEMEVWALEAYGAATTLQEMLTIKSDDVLGRNQTFESIVKGEDIKISAVPAAFNVLYQELRGLGFNIEINTEVPVKEKIKEKIKK
mgnify:CR=1 FL=1